MAMDTDTIPNLLGDARDQAPEELQEYFIAFEDYWERKLWHELTDKLIEFFEHPESAKQRIPFFETFIKSFANKINQLKLVTLGLSAATQFKGKWFQRLHWTAADCCRRQGPPQVRQRPRRERQQARLTRRLRLRHSRRRQHPAAVTGRGGCQEEAGRVRADPGQLRLGRDCRPRKLLQSQRTVLPGASPTPSWSLRSTLTHGSQSTSLLHTTRTPCCSSPASTSPTWSSATANRAPTTSASLPSFQIPSTTSASCCCTPSSTRSSTHHTHGCETCSLRSIAAT